VLDLTPGCAAPVLASYKAPTTPNVAEGIQAAIAATLDKAGVDKDRIQAVAIGTTSFVNSLLERDASKLDRVAVVRLCGPFSRMCPPFVSFPYELRAVLEGPVFFARGGIEVDGREIDPIDPAEIRAICATMREMGVRTIAVAGCYSPIDEEFRQEERVGAIIRAELPDVRVTLSKDVANIGLLQRENAAVLNAALLSFAERTVAGFRASTAALDLDCPIFLTSNDGTLMTCEQAARLPIRTFSSGPTNSMRGAHFLASLTGAKRETALVIDVGGTSTEIGVLLPTGFPRQAGAFHELVGVPLNFSMPHVHSMALGGGSRVRTGDKVAVGPDSVGFRITEEALCFGGCTLVATDIAVAAGQGAGVGDAALVAGLDRATVDSAQARIKTMIELAIDCMKTSTADVPVYLVGGGAILVPDQLAGVSKVHRFPHYDAANAVGAACAQISAVIDTFEDTSIKSMATVQREVEARAIARAVANGADPAHTTVVESEAIPIAYTAGKCRFYVKAAGEWTGTAAAQDGAAAADSEFTWDTSEPVKPVPQSNGKRKLPTSDVQVTAADILAYKPKIEGSYWVLSELDLAWIADGCYILGTGGGGNPATEMLSIRELVRAGGTVRVMDLETLPEDDKVVWGGGIGSPEVCLERLDGGDPSEATRALVDFVGLKHVGALAALEIGGGNGMHMLAAGCSAYLDVPVIDGDFMGRAYPTGWQTTVNVFDSGDRGEMSLPNAMCSGNGNNTFMTSAKHYFDIDRILRAGCVEMGTHADVAARPLEKSFLRKALVRNTVSQAWRLGRAVALATKQANIGNVGRVLVDAVGGDKAARVLFAGKVTEVGRHMHKGHTVGELTIQALATDEEDDPESPKQRFEGVLKSKPSLDCANPSPIQEREPAVQAHRRRQGDDRRGRARPHQCAGRAEWPRPRHPRVQVRSTRAGAGNHGRAAVDVDEARAGARRTPSVWLRGAVHPSG
jgi:N-methylhydantoinase A/oxoprolinase/acetone carboxylase beta subunit/DUF917 family protein